MAGKQSDGILEILFGVKGGGSVSGESGRQISADLTAIAKNIHPEIQFKLSKNQQSTFQAELDAIAKNLKLNIEANVTKVNMSGGSGTGGSGSRRWRHPFDADRACRIQEGTRERSGFGEAGARIADVCWCQTGWQQQRF